MTTIDEVDNKVFPILSKKKEEINRLYIGGENNMSGLSLEMYKDGLKEGRIEGMQKGEIEAFIKIYKKGLIKAIEASKMLNITEKDFLELVK